MSKNHLFAVFACIALLASGCDKTDKTDDSVTPADAKVTSADFVGSWYADEAVSLIFNENGSYTEDRWGESSSGTWSFNESDNTISFTPSSGDPSTVKALLIGGKAWLVLVEEFEGTLSYESYRKEGATVVSAPLGDGRWDAPHSGVKPAEYTREVDYRICMVVSGNTIDLYVPMWGYHIQGTFTLNDGKLHIETDDDHIFSGLYIDADGSFGWNGFGPPSADYDETWDYSYGSMDPETFTVRSPYKMYSISDMLKMGKKPVETDPEYQAEPFHFKFRMWTWAENTREMALDLCDFDLCVSPDGKEAFGGAVGLTPWFYKR